MVTVEVVVEFAATDRAATTTTTTTTPRTASPTILRLPSVTDRYAQSQRVEPEAAAADATTTADNAQNDQVDAPQDPLCDSADTNSQHGRVEEVVDTPPTYDEATGGVDGGLSETPYLSVEDIEML